MSRNNRLNKTVVSSLHLYLPVKIKVTKYVSIVRFNIF